MAKRRKKRKLTELQFFYRRYNKEYFNNRLPDVDEVTVRYGVINAIGQQCGFEIIINKKFRKYPSICLATLLHEQVHLLLDEDESHNTEPHGRKFQKEMRRLARIGAFDHVW